MTVGTQGTLPDSILHTLIAIQPYAYEAHHKVKGMLGVSEVPDDLPS